MSILYVNAKRMRRSILAALKWLVAKQEVLNKLNVYPVPDGDTGTNMVLTLKSAVASVEKGKDEVGEGDLADLSRRLSDGALMGARGNSGVILSQIIRGFADGLAGQSRIGARELAASFQEAVRRAYKAMANPVEGTILTVLRESTAAAAKVAEEDPDIIRFLETLHDEALASLERTPEKLPVLKEAGVVDSGAMGFVCMVEGIMRLIRGEELETDADALAAEVAGPVLQGADGELVEIGPRFCTEFLLHCGPGERDAMRGFLVGRGESLIFVADGDVVRVHVHTDVPAEILRHARGLGDVSREKVDDMQVQHGHVLSREAVGGGGAASSGHGSRPEPTPPKQPLRLRRPGRAAVGLLCTSPGDGFTRVFRSLGVQGIVPGGDTSNPSVEEILRAASAVDARQLVFLPNNKNIILAGEQAARASVQATGRPMTVLATKSVAQGVAAAVAFDPDAPLEESLGNMNEAVGEVKTLAVARAERDSSLDGVEIAGGEYFSLLDGRPVVLPGGRGSGSDLDETVIGSVRSVLDDEDVLAVYYGKDVAEAEAKALVERVGREFAGIEVELHEGGQPHYPYYVSLE